jgi:hypothetical protein
MPIYGECITSSTCYSISNSILEERESNMYFYELTNTEDALLVFQDLPFEKFKLDPNPNIQRLGD